MESVTGGTPKELLKLGRKTVLERIMDEARECDPDEIVVVSSPLKPQLSLAAQALGARVELQERPLGLAHAIAVANVQDDAIILLGDCAFFGGSPSARLAELARRGIDGCIAVEAVDDAGTWQYGIVEVDEMTGGVLKMIEKPGPDLTSSRWAVAARFSCGVRLMAFVNSCAREHERVSDVELPMTPVFQAAISEGFDLKAALVQPGQSRVDCGSPDEYQAALHYDWR